MKNFVTSWRGKTVAAGTSLMVMGSANAGLVQADVDAIKTAVLADAGIAVAAGFGVFAFVIGAKAGFGLLSRFINKGARG